MKQLFERLSEEGHRRAEAIYNERGDKYGDTWEDCQWLKFRAVMFTMFGIKLTKWQCRVCALATYGDMKYQRFQGGYADDHPLDGINYDAALVSAMREVYAEAGPLMSDTNKIVASVHNSVLPSPR